MNSKIVEEFAENFFNTFYSDCWNDKIKYSISDLSIQESYAAQDLVAKKRMAKGGCIIGYKVGCTSCTIQSQFGLGEPIFGRLFWPHIFDEGEKFNWEKYTNCTIEPEMVLKIGKDLKGENLPDKTLISAIEYVSPGIEIHNFKFWYTPPTLQELICSNGIQIVLVVGDNKSSQVIYHLNRNGLKLIKMTK